VRRLPDQSASGGQRVVQNASQASMHRRRATKVVAAAAEEAARLLSGVRIGGTTGPKAAKQPQSASSLLQQSKHAGPSSSGVNGAAVRYQTHVGAGGSIYTFEVAASGKGQTHGRSLVSEYMGIPRGSGSTAVPSGKGTGGAPANKKGASR